jgi:ABC-type antimicrobial peptide transport system permease subunit
MRDPYRPKKQRSRIGTIVFAGVGIVFATYIPANFILMWVMRHQDKQDLGKMAMPAAMAASALILILVSMRFTSIRQGLIIGGILGFLGGTGCLLGIANAMSVGMDVRLNNEAQHTQAETVADIVDDPTDEGEAKLEAAGKAELEKRRQLMAEMEMGRLVIICLPPNILLGLFIGGMFAKAAVRRRQRAGY